MTQRSWPWDTVVGLGDGAAELAEGGARDFLSAWFSVQNFAVEGVSKGVGGELAVSGNASPLTVQTGSGICYGLYINDALVNNLTVTKPSVGTTGGRVVLQTNWAGTGGAGLEARTRLAVHLNADGNPAIPALTQNYGTTWEISLATFTITTGGAITLTDDRTFRKSTMMVDTAEIYALAVETAKLDNLAVTAGKIGALAVETAKLDNLAVTAGKIGALAVETAKIDNLAVTAGKIGALAVETAKIQNNAVTDAKLRDSGALTVIGRAVNSVGDPADIEAGNEDTVLSRAASALAFTKISTAMIANDAVDDTKAGNRVPQFYRRQGGSATVWATPGTNNYTPTAVRMQEGVFSVSLTGGALSSTVTITFPVAFAYRPILALAISSDVPTQWWVVLVETFLSASTFRVAYSRLSAPGDETIYVHWKASGPE